MIRVRIFPLAALTALVVIATTHTALTEPCADEHPNDPAGYCACWADRQADNQSWLDRLPDCPCELTRDVHGRLRAPEPVASQHSPTGIFRWMPPRRPSQRTHPGAAWHIRSSPSVDRAGQQCCYDERGELITTGLAAGTPDRWAPWNPDGPDPSERHKSADVVPFHNCRAAGMIDRRCTGRFPLRPPFCATRCSVDVVCCIDAATFLSAVGDRDACRRL